MEDDGRDADEICTLGMGMRERLGGRGGIPLGVCARAYAAMDMEDERDCVGENARSAHSESEGDVDIERQWFEGAGI